MLQFIWEGFFVVVWYVDWYKVFCIWRVIGVVEYVNVIVIVKFF